MKKLLAAYVVFFGVLTAFVGVTYAAFSHQLKITGAVFTTGSADIKFLLDISKGTDEQNLADQLQGPSFLNVGPAWHQDYLVKIFNNSNQTVSLLSNANYVTENDPADLRQYIYVEAFPWTDANANGVLDTGELGVAVAKKTIIKWKTEGIDLGQVGSGQVKGLVLRFSAESLPDSKQGQSGMYDFEFNGLSL